jgi:alpha-methylacyl-CoA racemase
VGPLRGYRIIEIAGLGPAPFTGMMLSDMGAEVLRIDRAGPPSQGPAQDPRFDVLARGRRSVAVNLKHPEGIETILKLLEQADGLIEGFRPGVMERLGLGPEPCLARNPKLVYGRMTGWGQEGPLAEAAGHDINYIALTGALHSIGRAEGKPVPPLNLVGDFGGGGIFLAFGMVCGILEAIKSGQGQVVDAAMVDGASTLMGLIHGLMSEGNWVDQRSSNMLDTGTHYYDTYECADGKFVAVGAIEPKFYQNLLVALDLSDDPEMARQNDPAAWPDLKKKFTTAFLTRSRDEWCDILEGSDACFAPVLSLAEVPDHHHMKDRGVMIKDGPLTQPAPAPRFSRTIAEIQGPPVEAGHHTSDTLIDWGFEPEVVERLLDDKVVMQSQKT